MPVLIFSIFLFQIGMIYLFIYSFSIIKFLICSSFIYVFFAWEFENSQKCNKKAVKLRDVWRERYQRVEDAHRKKNAWEREVLKKIKGKKKKKDAWKKDFF